MNNVINTCKCCREDFAATSSLEEYCCECEQVKRDIFTNKQTTTIAAYTTWAAKNVAVFVDRGTVV